MDTVSLDPRFVAGVVEDLPPSVRILLERMGAQAILAGGFIRSHVDGTATKDIDIFVGSEAAAVALIPAIVSDPFREVYKTHNAISVPLESSIGKPDSVQLIYRNTSQTPEGIIADFDYSNSAAAIWFDKETHTWKGIAEMSFQVSCMDTELYVLKGFHNRSSIDTMDSFKRMLRFVKAGYTVPEETLATVLAVVYEQCGRDKQSLLEAITESRGSS